MKSLYLVEDEPLLRELFGDFAQMLTDFEYLGSSGDGAEALKECLRLRPSIIVLDIRLPGINGIDMLGILRRELPESRVILFTGAYTAQMVELALTYEAAGIVEKSAGLLELKRAIETVASGERFFSEQLKPLLRTLVSSGK